MKRVVPRGIYGHVVVLAVVLSAVAMGIWWTVRHADRQMRGELLAQTRLAAQALSLDDVKELTGTDADLASPSYDRLKKQLARVKQAREDCRFAYLLGRHADGSIFFFVDNEPHDSGDCSPPGQVYTEASADMRRAFETGKATADGPVDDRWGTWITGLVPIVDPKTGELLAVLGMDGDASAWNRDIAARTVLPAGLMLALLIVLLTWLAAARTDAVRSARPIQRRLMVPLAAVLLLLVAGFSFALFLQQRARLGELSRLVMNEVSRELARSLVEHTQAITSFEEMLVRDATLREALAAKDRGRLLSNYQRDFDQLAEMFGLTHLNFLDADRHVLLRMHRPELHGDQIDRFTMLEAQRTQDAASGIDIGRTGSLTLRVVRPVFGQQGIVGYIELGKEVEGILSDLHQPASVELAVMIRKKYLKRGEWESALGHLGIEADWNRLPNHVLTYSTLPNLPETAKDILAASRRSRGNGHAEAAFAGKTWRLMAESIVDASGNVAGELIVMHDISTAKSEQRRLMAVAIGGSLVLLVGLLGFVFVLLGNTDKGIQRQQSAIRDSEARLRAITDSAQDAILMMDSHGAISFWNPAATAILGYRSEEVLGKNLHELLAPERYHEAQRKAFPEFVRNGRGDAVGKTLELAARRKDGKELAVSLSLSAVSLDGQWHAVGILRDVTEKKRAADRLEEALNLSTRRQAETEALLAAARAVLENRTFEAAARRIFDLCKQGVGATAGYVALLAENQEENQVLFLDAGGMPCNVAPSLPMPLRGLRSVAYETRRPAYDNDFGNSEWVRFMPAGHVALKNVLFSPLVLDGRAVGLIGLANKPGDFTDEDAAIAAAFGEIAAIALLNSRTLDSLVETQEQLREQTKRATQMADEARAANATKSQFLANMSHEIRTPMTAILGFSDILLQEASVDRAPPEHIEAIRTIQRNGQYLLDLINDILDLSKIEAGKLDVERIACSPVQVISDVMSLMRVRAEAKGLSLDVEYAGAMPESIQCDPLRLRQILINLVGNAVKFTETGGVRLVAHLVHRLDGPSLFQIDVVDTGIGLTRNEIPGLFSPFTQADSSTTRRFGGTGLGLTISKRLAEMLGGDISVESTPNKGSTFSVTVETGSLDGVELLDAPREASVASKSTSSTAAPAVRLDCRILLAEDGPDNQRLISFLLRKAGAEVTVAENGQTARDLALAARDGGCPFDVVLMDMQMPVMDGYEATRRLRAEGYTGPIIALTAHAMEQDAAACRMAGCDAYLTKPINPAAFLPVIAEYAAASAGKSPAEPSACGPKGSDEGTVADEA